MPHPTPQEFAHHFRTMRMEADVTRGQLAARTGLPADAIARIEQNGRTTHATAAILLEALGIPDPLGWLGPYRLLFHDSRGQIKRAAHRTGVHFDPANPEAFDDAVQRHQDETVAKLRAELDRRAQRHG